MERVKQSNFSEFNFVNGIDNLYVCMFSLKIVRFLKHLGSLRPLTEIAQGLFRCNIFIDDTFIRKAVLVVLWQHDYIPFILAPKRVTYQAKTLII